MAQNLIRMSLCLVMVALTTGPREDTPHFWWIQKCMVVPIINGDRWFLFCHQFQLEADRLF
jgi:hypothetical protein